MKSPSTACEFQYVGINKFGQKKKGYIQADCLSLAQLELGKKGLIIHNMKIKRQPLFNRFNKKITPTDISLFSRQIATMITAGIPIIQAFDVVAKGQRNRRLKVLIETIKKDIETGLTLTQSLSKHPSYFNELFCSLVHAGEKSGSLDVMLEKIATHKEKMETLKKKIKKALTYPVAIMIMTLFVSSGLLFFVVPQFESIFKGLGAELPVMTQMVVTMSNCFKKSWFLLFGGLGTFHYAFIYAKNNSSRFAQALDRLLLNTPIIGNILEKSAIARFTNTLAITFAAGLPLLEALGAAAGTAGNRLYIKAMEKIKKEVSTGQCLNVAMENTGLYPTMVVQMVAIGEESGTLDNMLEKIAGFYAEDVDNSVDSLSRLLEPIIMCVLGVLVGGLIIAMYLPLFKLGTLI